MPEQESVKTQPCRITMAFRGVEMPQRQQGKAEDCTGLNLKEVQPISYRTLGRMVCTSRRKVVSSSTVGSRLAASTQSSRKAAKRWMERQIQRYTIPAPDSAFAGRR